MTKLMTKTLFQPKYLDQWFPNRGTAILASSILISIILLCFSNAFKIVGFSSGLDMISTSFPHNSYLNSFLSGGTWKAKILWDGTCEKIENHWSRWKKKQTTVTVLVTPRGHSCTTTQIHDTTVNLKQCSSSNRLETTSVQEYFFFLLQKIRDE